MRDSRAGLSAASNQYREKGKNRGLGTRRGGIDADLLACAPTFKLHHSLNKSEESVILAQAHVETRKEFCSSLTDDDGPGLDGFPTIGFDSEILRITVSPVS